MYYTEKYGVIFVADVKEIERRIACGRCEIIGLGRSNLPLCAFLAKKGATKMKKLHRIIPILLALVMVLSLCACGGKTEPAKTDSPKTETTKTDNPVVPTPEPAPEAISARNC